MASICDTCMDPGHCCRAFPLSIDFPIGMPREEVQECVAEGRDPEDPTEHYEPMPFVPLRRMWPKAPRGARAPTHARWLFTCPKLGPDGRCTVYEARPRTCRSYEPGCDEMCVHYQGPWGGKMARLQDSKEGDHGEEDTGS